MAHGSDVVVVGKVLRILDVPWDGEPIGDHEHDTIRVAEVEVLELIKGDPGLKRVWYLAQGTWCCDVSTARLGETALFFFEKTESYTEVEEVTGSETLMRDLWSGHGRMPISLFEGKEYIEVDADIVRVTASLSLARIGTPEAVNTLMALPGSKNVWTRRAAAHAFENGPCEAGVEILIKALEDPDEEVVRLAIFALGEIGPAAAAAIPALEKMRGTNAREALEKIRKK